MVRLATTALACSHLQVPSDRRNRTDVVADPEVDAIIIGTWPYTHKTMVIAALENKKHVMTEARMAMNATEAEVTTCPCRSLRSHSLPVPDPTSG
jgi:predicted dehydrogenase